MENLEKIGRVVLGYLVAALVAYLVCIATGVEFDWLPIWAAIFVARIAKTMDF